MQFELIFVSYTFTHSKSIFSSNNFKRNIMKTKFTFSSLLIGLLFAFQYATAATATFNVTVPNDGGSDGHHQTNRCMIVGNFNGWNAAGAIDCQKVDNTHYTVTLDESTFTDKTVTLATINYKYISGPDWAYVMKAADGTELGNNTYAGTSPQTDVVVYWASVWKNVAPVPGYFTISLWAPTTVKEAYCTGNFNGWATPGFVGKQDSTSTKMTLDAANSTSAGNLFNVKIYTSNAWSLAFQITTGPSWIYQQVQGNDSYTDPTQPSILFDAVGDPTANPPIAPALTFKRIYPGAANLKTVTLKAKVPANTTAAYVMGSLNGGANSDFIAGTNNNDGTFSFSVPGVDIFNYNYYLKADAASIEVKVDNTAAAGRVADAQIATNFTDTIGAWTTTAVQQINLDKYRIYTNHRSIIVDGVQSNVTVFSIDGQMIESKQLNGLFTSKALNNGMYIIRVDGATQKVIVQ